MVNLYRLEIIKTKPIGEGLNAYCDSFDMTCKDLGMSSSVDALHQIGNEGLQSLALDLILALQSLPASRLLPSNSLSRNLFGDLSRLNSAVNSDGFDLERITPLLNAVRNNEFDEVVWNKVYAAIIESTPPPRPIPLHNQTPTRDCSEALRNFQQSPIKKVIQRLHCLPQDTSSNPDHIFWNTPYIKLLSETHCNRSLACSDSAAAWVRLGPSNTGRVPVGSGTSSAGCLAS